VAEERGDDQSELLQTTKLFSNNNLEGPSRVASEAMSQDPADVVRSVQ